MNAQEYIDYLRTKLGGDIIYKKLFYPDAISMIYSLEKTGLYSAEKIQELKDAHKGLTHGEALNQLVSHISDKILDQLSFMGYHLSESPKIGIIPTHDFNALATKAPNGENICLIDDFLWGTVGCISRAVCEYVFEGKEQKEGNREIALNVLLGALIWFSGDFQKLAEELLSDYKKISTDPIRVFAASQLVLGLIVFIISHEFSHHALGHLGKPVKVKLIHHRYMISTRIYNRIQQDEFDADMLAFRIFLNFSRKQMDDGSRELFSQGEISPLLFFLFLEVYEKILAEKIGVNVIFCETHPPARDRRMKLLEKFNEIAHENAKNIYPYVSKIFEKLMSIASFVIKNLKVIPSI